MKYHWQSKHNMWGRFGGGWNWNPGVKIGSRTVDHGFFVFTLLSSIGALTT